MKNYKDAYFLNSTFGYKLTGIEHAAIHRLKLFKSMGVSCKIITMNYSTELTPILKMHNLMQSDFLNLYRSFQKFNEDINFTLENLLDRVDQATCEPIGEHGLGYRVYSNNIFVMYVHCFSGTKRISYINYFDIKRVKVRRELYDYLGYKSCEIILANKIAIQSNYFDYNGQIYLSIRHADGENFYTLSQYEKTLFFKDLTELQTYWLNQISFNASCFFIDKNRLYNPLMQNIENKKIKKITIIHSTHTNNPNIIGNKKINSNYKYFFENQNYFDACVVATQAQYQDLIKDIDMKVPAFVISPSYITEHRVNSDLSLDNFRILSIGRIAVEKRHEDMIMAMKTVVKSIPHAKLEFYGLGNAEILSKLKSLIQSESLDDNVIFKEYSHNIKDELYNSHLSLVTSKVESFCIAILDSLEQGTPVISYNIKYGPSAIIENGFNGELIEDGNIDGLAEAIIKYFRENHIEYSKNTKMVLMNYSKQNVMKHWFDLLCKLGLY